MKQYSVDVGLCLQRPPRLHRTSRVHLLADSAWEAEETAMLIAIGVHHAVMAVSSVVIDWPDT